MAWSPCSRLFGMASHRMAFRVSYSPKAHVRADEARPAGQQDSHCSTVRYKYSFFPKPSHHYTTNCAHKKCDQRLISGSDGSGGELVEFFGHFVSSTLFLGHFVCSTHFLGHFVSSTLFLMPPVKYAP